MQDLTAIPPQNGYLRTNSKKPKRAGKLDLMLNAFANGSHLNRFQAERLGDHCLHTTVSDLQLRHSIRFSRKWVKVPNRFGSRTRVMSYWLDGEDLIKASEIVGQGEKSK